MATYTDNYQLTKPTYAEQADIGVINSNMNIIDDVMHSSQISLAPAYDQSQTYAEGDVVMYELLMYKCISPTTGVWDGSKWERTTASESGGGGSAELDILGEASGAVASFADGASAELAKCIAEIVPKQAGSGTPSPSNVRAISGYTAVKVDVAGKNLLNGIELGAYRAIDAETVTASNRVRSSSIFFLKQGTYTFSASTQASGKTIRAFYQLWANDSYGANTPLNTPQWESNPMTFTLNADTFVSIILGYTDDSNVTVSDLTAQLEKGSMATTYEPYIGKTYTTPLGQTVYGGRLNVVTGELTVTYGYIASYNGETLTGEWLSDRDEYTSGGTPTTGAEVVYELATPQTVQLTPQEVNSLLGQNNISADTGDVDIVYVKASAPIQPNPTGTPTATLKKLGIEGTVFEIPSGGGGSSSGINYSTTEQIIGTFEDENGIIKPLYQKMVRFTNVAKNGTIPFGVTGGENYMLITGRLSDIMPFPYIHGSAPSNNIGGFFNSDAWNLRSGAEAPSTVTGFMIIQYTKITD